MSAANNNPFPGLRSFDFEESHLFFGREKHISDLLRKLNSNHFVAIVGTSGSGKSSLVRAGLLPAIHNGKSGKDGTDWIITTLKPGNTAVKNLAKSLISKNVFSTGDAVKDSTELDHVEKLLRASQLGLVQAVRGLLPPNKSLLILLDQFEETFRFSGEGMEHNDDDSTQFVNLIIDAVRQRDVPIYVVLTIRSDFLGDCARFEGLPEAINDGHYLVPRLTNDQNKSVITGPVNYAEGKISPRLVQRVINDLGDNPDQLPVLQHALMRTWDIWKENAESGEPMDIRHYEMIGGMEHALSNHADEAFNELSESQKKTAENIFKCLTLKSGENRGIRRPTSVKRLMEITGTSFEGIKETMNPFRKAGRTFVLPSSEIPVSESTVMDISHESLMRAWTRLKHWVEEESESASIYHRLCESALLNREGKAALWRNPELQMALDWKTKSDPNEAWSLQYNNNFKESINFLDNSLKEDLSEKAKLNKRKRAVRTAVTAFLIIVTFLSGWALLQTKEAKTQSALADKNRIDAEQKAVEAINQKQLAEKAKEMALDASKKAMDAKSYAELQSTIAGEQRKLADEQKTKAEQEAIRATQQQQLAERKGAEAFSEKQKADSAHAQAERLRLISISQNIAFKSLQEKNDEQLSALLAYQAYKLASENGGNLNDAQLYNALNSSAQKIDDSFKPVVLRESGNINALSVSGKNIAALMQNNLIKNFSTDNYSVASQNKLNGLTSNSNTWFISRDGGLSLIGMEDNAAAVFNLKTPGDVKLLSGHDGLIRAAAFSADGSAIVTGARDSCVIIWENYTLRKKIKCSSRIKALAFGSGDKKIYAGGEDGKVVSMNSDGSEVQPFANGNGRVQSIACDGKLIAIGYSGGTMELLNTNGQNIRTMNEPASADLLSLDEKNGLLSVGLSNKTIHVYHLSDSGKPIEINCNSVINALDMNPDFIYVACADNSLRCYPLKTTYFEKIFAQNLKRSLTKEEWGAYIGNDVAYDK